MLLLVLLVPLVSFSLLTEIKQKCAHFGLLPWKSIILWVQGGMSSLLKTCPMEPHSSNFFSTIPSSGSQKSPNLDIFYRLVKKVKRNMIIQQRWWSSLGWCFPVLSSEISTRGMCRISARQCLLLLKVPEDYIMQWLQNPLRQPGRLGKWPLRINFPKCWP